MSVDVIDNDCNKTFDNSKWVTSVGVYSGSWIYFYNCCFYICSLNKEDKTHNYNNMDELEKKIKNEV